MLPDSLSRKLSATKKPNLPLELKGTNLAMRLVQRAGSGSSFGSIIACFLQFLLKDLLTLNEYVLILLTIIRTHE